MIDRIHIEQLEIHARVSVADSERAQPQRLTAGGKPSTTHTTEYRTEACDLLRVCHCLQACRLLFN